MVNEQECVLRCADGYRPSGRGVIKCELGNWRQLGECRPADCEYIPAVEYAATDLDGCAGTKHGENCPFECERGFEKSQPLTCLFGQFVPAKCKALECKEAPVVPGIGFSGVGHCFPLASGSICSVHCEYGQKLTAPLYCDHGSWTKVSCVPIQTVLQGCDHAPFVPRAADVSTCTEAEAGQACSVECDPGYLVDGMALCVNTRWTFVRCVPRMCETPPSVPFSVDLWKCSGYDSFSRCMLACLPGFSPSGLGTLVPDQLSTAKLRELIVRSSLLCRGGDWSGAHCMEAPCDSPPARIRHAHPESVLTCAGVPSRQTCRFQCYPGYYAVAFPECIRGVWILPRNVRCEEAPCTDLPDVKHGLGLAQCVDRQSGDYCPLQCEEGYEPSGDLYCKRGVWAPATCLARCSEPPVAISDAGDLSHCAGTPVGSYCSLVCHLGFRASSDLYCHEGKQWDNAFCFDVAEALDESVDRRILLSGLHLQTEGELRRAVSSFRVTLAKVLHVAVDLVSVELRPHGEAGRMQHMLELRILCKPAHCPDIEHRCTEELKPGLDEKLLTEYCFMYCKQIAEEPDACHQHCRLLQPLRIVSFGSSITESVDIDDGGAALTESRENVEEEVMET
eukprot:gnl/TRDRNA2_/TRDRNA2_116419_c2_seq1.p1 gnl/TRDRNA2_/TRDRNA2_116419_c2~~gnl/TRDRNA2_/TRDRNA2_116419_c2_seq1.p1  ORF type:complete len:627 (-),score=71.44 gnl/TRDRNA2_/TRDRNA2_116419_c2_seq1:139-1998(-)